MAAGQIAALLLGIVPLDMPVVEQVASVELNHFHDGDGKHIFDQLIWREWDSRTKRQEIVAWKIVKDGDKLPVGGVHLFWDSNVLREVKATSSLESWSQHDPELIERESLPKEMRREWMKPTRKQDAVQLMRALEKRYTEVRVDQSTEGNSDGNEGM